MSSTDSTVSVDPNPAHKRKWSLEKPPYMRIVLLGKDVLVNSRVGNFMLCRSAFETESSPDDLHCTERVRGKHMTLINCPHLLQHNLSSHHITQTLRECVSLSHPGPHVIILIFKHDDECSREDQEHVNMILNSLSDSVYEHTLVLTTHHSPHTHVNDNIQEMIRKCLNKHYRLERNSSPSKFNETLENIVQMNSGRHLMCEESLTMKHQTEERDVVKLNVVVCGSDRILKSFISKLMLNESSRRSELRSDCVMKREMEVCGRLINLLELPDLFNTSLSDDELMRQTLCCLSLCHPGVHVFLLIIPHHSLTDEHKAEMQEIHRIFSSRIRSHMMILIKQKSEDTTAELDDVTQSVIKCYAAQCHFIHPNTQVSTLLERIQQMTEDNRGASFTTQTFLYEQMKKMKDEEMKTQILLPDHSEIRDEVRIVLLGKTGVGKSASGNTILGRDAFPSDVTQESITKECQKETTEIKKRLITVIDTPGLFDTELSEEEIQREVTNCISMILPGPHVFLLLVPLGRFTKEEATAVKIIQETFGKMSSMYTMVLFTRGDHLKNKTIEEFLGKPGSPLRKLIEECGNRYHVFNNTETEDRTQVSDLLEKIDLMVTENEGSNYSCKRFREMEREKQEQHMKTLMERIKELNREKEEERERMKMRMKEETQKHERERKTREEEIIQREERYKREIKEIEEKERQMLEDMRREREEWEKQRQEEKARREEDEKEKQIHVEQCERLKREMEEMMREKERIEREKQHQLEEFEKRVQEERNMREEQEKNFEEQLKLMKEESEDQLKRRRTEMREEYEEICPQLHDAVQISAYRRLETEYSRWSWTLCSNMMKIENKLHNQIENEAIHEIDERDLYREIKEKSDEVNKSMSEFFEKGTDADLLIQWKTSFEIKIKELQENIVRETKKKLNEILQQRDLKREIDDQRTHHENTLLEKSKELALKHKDKTNDEETQKREFDVFWEESVKKITRDSPPIKDIDILRDVREIITDINKSFHIDQSIDIRNIFTVQSYSDYVQFKRFSGNTGPVRNVFRAAKDKLGYSLSKEDEAQIRTFITAVSGQTDEMIQSFNISKLGYNISCIQHLTDHIKATITQYEKGPVKYVFKNEFFIDLVFFIFKRSNNTFTDQHRMFREANDPVLYLEKKKREYYSVFQKYCQGATSAAIIGEIMCQKLKEPIEQSVYRQTARDLADEMRSNCPSLRGNRSNLEKHILKRLAEEENFDKYIDYIKNPRDHFKSFIRDEVSQYIRDQFSVSVQLKMNQNIELLQKKIMTAAHESTQHVQENRGNVDVWLKFFTLKLSDVLMFSVKDFSGVKHDDVDDFKLLEDVIRKYLPPVISDISREFSTDSFNKKLDVNYRSDEILIDHLCQCCWVQCSFCGAICTNTLEDHDGDHSVPSHRVTGINGKHYSGSTNLCISICTSQVASVESFYSHASDDQRVLWRKYRRAGGVYPNWSITPDLYELFYWKWFVCRFQKDLERYYEKTFQGRGKIPDEWREITKHEAIESLDKCVMKQSLYTDIKRSTV